MDNNPKKELGHSLRMDNNDHKREFLDILAAELPPVIARKNVERFLGGIITRKTLANADARGEGPKVAYAIGRIVAYRREALLDYISDNFTVQRLEGVQDIDDTFTVQCKEKPQDSLGGRRL